MDSSRGGADLMILEDFGQRVDLTRRIREILVNYPEGTTVLKELIQNADDAGATKFCLCLDRRFHGVKSLLSSKLGQWQGPALLAYNDAMFTEEDFSSISRVGDSKKEGQAWKTGRFGVGFNSVYHLTDLPSFVSNKYVVLFDPHGSYLPNISTENPGKRLEYVSSSAICLYEDQFLPYCAFGCDMKNPFHGTLFRFPLRNVDQAAVSKLSKQTYSESDISFMFSKLYEEALFCLLFLKSIISIEMFVWDAGLDKPRKLYSCSISPSDEKIAWHRKALLRLASLDEVFGRHVDSFSISFLSETIIGENSEKKKDSFLVVQSMAPATSRVGSFAITAGKDYDLHLLPWASVAVCLSEDLPENHVLKQGQAFCFLPLPVKTGLRVHVNGYFEVSSNRRSIWFGADMDRSGKQRSDWNTLLLEDVVAPAFVELLINLRRLLGQTKEYYSFWPTGTFEEPWNILVEKIYQDLYLAPVLYSSYEGGKWISPADALFHDLKFRGSESLGKALVLLGVPLVYAPSIIVDTLFKYCSNFQIKVVSPLTVRNFLKGSGQLGTLNKHYKLVLLEYCLTDLSIEDVGKHVKGLPLLPLANGEFGTFSETMQGIHYFICNDVEFELLCQNLDIVIDRTIPSDLFVRLSTIARSSQANLIFFNEENFLELFPRFFPPEWKYKNRVLWTPGLCTTYPTAAWFSLFWKYVQDQAYDVLVFHEWPVFPSTSGYLYRASKSSKLVNAEKLSYSLRALLVKIGCKILDPAYGIMHHGLSAFVSDGDAGSILNSIFDNAATISDLQGLFQEIPSHEKIEFRQFLLDPKWYHGGFLSDIHIKNAKKLPIYTVYDEQRSFHNLESHTIYLPPVDLPEFFLDGDFFFCSSVDEEEILIRYYGVERMPKASFYRKYVLGRLGELQSNVRDAIMLSILKELPQLSMTDSSFRDSLRTLKFLPTVNGSLDCPQSLYDPRIDELYALLDKTCCFPGGLFGDDNVLDVLLGLGLRTSVSADTVIKSARHVESLMRTDQLKAYSQGKVLLSYLEVHASKWLIGSDLTKGADMIFSRATAKKRCDIPSHDSLEKFWNDLRMICWCPALVSAPHPALPWPAVTAIVAPPKIVRLREDIWLVSASSRILDGECCSSFLSSSLGWSSPPSGNVIAAQLLELGKNNEIVTDQVLRQALAVAMPKIYSILITLIGSEEMDIVKAILEGSRWIWVGDGFSTVNEVVLNGQFHLAPYMRVIPVDLAVFRDLFLELGIKEYLKPVDYANILFQMAAKKGCSPLDTQEFRATVLMAQSLAEIQFDHLNFKIYLPDLSSRLIPATDLVYNDAPWLLDLGENTCGNVSSVSLMPTGNINNFVHGNISNDIAEKLGVRSLRRLLLAESSVSMNLSLSGVAEAFGQHEALTTRLKHIVEMYADGPGILFELVQNAEDAQASEVVFLLDKTQYGTSSILSPQMAEWQGPALYCFNDSVFSSQDLYAISRIGQDTKLDKPFAIGRFGLGFNCVYHFTDIPGFVSGESIVIFDPHASHLPGISPTHPGLRIKFVGRRILEQFPDQFTPFLHFGCDLQQPFSGTLFRFPLRNETTAHKSHIKKEKYSPDDVQLLFSSFIEVVSETLLFLHNIQKVSIFLKDGSDNDMQLIHRVSRHAINGLVKEPQPYHNMLSFVHGNQLKGIDRTHFKSKLDKISDTDLPWNCQKILLLEQSLSGSFLHVWFVSECIGGGRAKSKSLSVTNLSLKFIPWGSVAAFQCTYSLSDSMEVGRCLSTSLESFIDLVAHGQASTVHDSKEFLGRAFCFLPLPINTGLPTHVNAYFELSSNRRDIWFGNDMAGGGKVRSEWNLYLLEDAIAPAYGRLLVIIAQEVGPCDLFYSFWPTATGNEPWASMVRKFYVSLSDLGLSVLFTKARGGQWISAKQAIFPDFAFPKVVELAEFLSEAGLPVVNVSNKIVDRFMDFCPSLHFLTPQLLRGLLIRHKRGFKKKDWILIALEYCLSDFKEFSYCDSLFGLPLVPLANGLHSTFSKWGDGERVFVTSNEEYDLLRNSVPYLLVDCNIPYNVLNKLRDLADTGQTNLHKLTCQSLVELFPRVLPTEWQYAKQVFWTPGHNDQPTLEWMELFWSYLKASCSDLTLFDKWPILPVKNDFLLPLVENSAVIRDDGWSENLCSLLQKLGCYLLRSDLTIDHPHLRNFVQDATGAGFLNALIAVPFQLQDIKDLFVSASKAEMRELRSFIFQSRWFSGNQMGTMQIEMIKELPIFESYGNEVLVSLTCPVKWLKPIDVQEHLLDENFIKIESDREKSILQCYMGISIPTKVEFYKKFVLHRFESFLAQPSILLSILTDVKLIAEEDDSLGAALVEMPFVLAADGSWKHPSRLYDPRVPGLQDLLNKEAFFPSDKFLDLQILDILTIFGLRKSLNLSGLIDAARSVSMLRDTGNVDAPRCGWRLLSYLNALGIMLSVCRSGENKHKMNDLQLTRLGVSDEKVLQGDITEEKSGEYDQDVETFLSTFVHDMPEDEFWSEIKTIPWCPVYTTPLLAGQPWFTSDENVATPNTTRPKSQMWQVCSTMRVLDGDCYSTYVLDKLGWSAPPDIRTLSEQLIALSKSYKKLKLQSDYEFDIDVVLQREIPLLYSMLQGYIDTNDFQVMRETLDGIEWFWVGDNFVSPKSVAFDSPVKYYPYLYAVPSELSEFRALFSRLGVRLTFDAMDYLHVLQGLQHDVNGQPLSAEQLSLVCHVLEAFADSVTDKQCTDALLDLLLIPNDSGVLMHPSNLVYNDAPWMNKSNPSPNHFVHSDINNDLAKRLGVQSLRLLSLVNEKMTRDLPCMDYARISELLALYGESDFLLFDLLELADYIKAKKLHLIYDKRQHPKQSLLQHNLGDFQGSSLTVILEGATLSIEEVCSLQLPPPWKIRNNTLNYGLGLIGSYFVCDIMTLVSGGYFYIFDPLGLVLGPSSEIGPSAKLFSLIGNDLTERFHDQFYPLLLNQGFSSSTSDSTFIRMPLSSKCMDEHRIGCKRVSQIFDRFMCHASSTLLSLKSIFQVSLSTWEEGNPHPTLDYSVSIDPSSSAKRNPFSEKKWRKFNISRLFSSSHGAVNMHVIDVQVIHGKTSVLDQWLVVLCLGSGQTRNMALDRHYLSYNLTPVAGVAAHISQNGQPINPPPSSCILSPLPLSGEISMPVTVLGCFLIFHNGGRYLFSHSNGEFSQKHISVKAPATEAWNKELLLCIRDSYVELVSVFQKVRKNYLNSPIESSSARALSYILLDYGDRIYSFWPRSKRVSKSSDEVNMLDHEKTSSKASEAQWAPVVEQVIRPFYVRLVDLPVWQLYGGNVVKAEEGMFLSQCGGEIGDNLPPDSVYSFIKEHYPVFSVPCELLMEIQAIGVKVSQITPKMIRSLLKAFVSVLPQSIQSYIDVLDYCLSDIQMPGVQQSEISGYNNRGNSVSGSQIDEMYPVNLAPSSSSMNTQHSAVSQSTTNSGGDALDIVSYLGKALYDFGRGVVEDIGRVTDPTSHVGTAYEGTYGNQSLSYILAELKGLPFPTATMSLVRLGSAELWIGNQDQQLLMHPLADKFVHTLCLEKPYLAKILCSNVIHRILKLRSFTFMLLSDHLDLLFAESWVNNVLAGSRSCWVPWKINARSLADGPSPEWLRLFWKIFKDVNGDLSVVAEWPFIPAILNGPILCRVKDSNLVFVPPLPDPASIAGVSNIYEDGHSNSSKNTVEELRELYLTEFESISFRYPWLLSLLYQLSIPVCDMSFLDIGVSCNLFPTPGQSLGQVIISKLHAAKCAGSFSIPLRLLNEDRDRLFALFASDFDPHSGCVYRREELDVLKELPIYKTVTGSYTMIVGNEQCVISSTAFFHPKDERCLTHSADSYLFLHALGVNELTDQEVFSRFGLPGFEGKSLEDKENLLLYLHMNWDVLQSDSSIVNSLKETNFIRNASESCTELFKPRDLLDPHDSLLSSIFCGERNRFPGERFTTEKWLRILRKAGLCTSSQADILLECARKVELFGTEVVSNAQDPQNFEANLSLVQNEVSQEIISLAESVVDAIFTNFPSLFDNDFCEKIRKISFVPAEKGLPTIGGKKGGKRILSSYRDAILFKDWPLAWSTSPILVKQNVIPPEFSWGAFHLRSPPPFTFVLKHLLVVGRNNGEDVLACWPTSPGMMTVVDATFEIFKYLDKIWGTLSSKDIKDLQKVAFIPVANGTRLVSATSLFVRLSINLSPFAFELPSIYLPFVKILKEMGLQEVLTVKYAREIILNLQKSCGYQRLNPNELRAIMEILKFICDEYMKSSADRSGWQFDAIVPDDGCRLVSAISCVFVDSYGSQFLGKIDTSRLRFSHPELPENICIFLGIKKISDVVIEELDEPHLQVVDQIGSVPLDKIKDKLLSKPLQHALWTLIDGMRVHCPSIKGLNLVQVERSLSEVASRLQFVKLLLTRFLLLPKNVDITRVPKDDVIPEWDWTHKHRTMHFVNKTSNIIYVAEPPSYISIYDLVAIVVSQVLELPNIIPFGPLLACPDGSEKAALIAMKLRSETGTMTEGECKNLVGKELLPQDALQVQFLPMRPFYRGEIVAWKPGNESTKLRYGIVPQDVRPYSSQAMYKFSVEIAPGEYQTLLSTQVFSFRSVSMGNVIALLPFSSNSGTTSESRLVEEAGNGKSKQQMVKELQYGRVSAEETVRAVNEMLLAAGINMDVEQQTLLQTTLTLQEQVKEFQVALLVEQEKADKAGREADAAKAAWSCRVCLGSEVDTTMFPCGHVMCHRCCSAVSRCPFCRSQVSSKLKIFRP